jgi:hypothetical protein
MDEELDADGLDGDSRKLVKDKSGTWNTNILLCNMDMKTDVDFN